MTASSDRDAPRDTPAPASDTFKAFVALDPTFEGTGGQPGRYGPLAGMRIGVKDNIDVAALPTRAGFARPHTVLAERDAPCVARLRAAGALIVGKLNMDEGALGATGINPHFGRVFNPRDPTRVAGGSSAGSAAAVAAGLTEATLGTDTLGSVRIPASYCGVVGFKPSLGVISTEGVVPLSWHLDHVGVLARKVSTVAAVHGVMSEAAAPLLSSKTPSAWRLAALDPDALGPVEPSVLRVYLAGLKRLSGAGFQVESYVVGAWEPSSVRRAAFLLVEAEAAVVYEAALAADDPALSPAFKAMLHYGRDCASGRLVRALQTIDRAAEAWRRILVGVDAVLLPTTPQTAFPADAPAPASAADLVAPANITGAPAISLPYGLDAEGLPVGLQLVALPGTDGPLLALAALIEKILGAG